MFSISVTSVYLLNKHDHEYSVKPAGSKDDKKYQCKVCDRILRLNLIGQFQNHHRDHASGFLIGCLQGDSLCPTIVFI